MAKDTTAARAGGGAEGGALDPEAPAVKALVDAAVAREVAGLEQAKAALEEEKRRLAERLKAGEGRAAELETLVKARDEQLARLAIDGRIREAASRAALVPSAIEDVLGRGRRVFALDEAGSPVARNAAGEVIAGKDGESPLTPAEWLETMKETAPHWWPPSSGAGAPGAGARGGEGALTYEQAGELSPEHYARLRRDGRIS
jgi:hypothetical protein